MRESIQLLDRVVWTGPDGALHYGRVIRPITAIVTPEDSGGDIAINVTELRRMVPLEEITQEARAESADAAIHLELATMKLRAAEARLTPTSGVAAMLAKLAEELLETATGLPEPAARAIVDVARKMIEALE